MYKVVLVDDDKMILENLIKNVSWQKWNCKVVATAMNGEQAWKVIEEYQPHIIFTDIEMPRVDGLKMIAGLKSESTSAEIAILTGFRKFDYAQEAVGLGVCRFLLKPYVIAEIEETLKNMVENIKMKEKVSYNNPRIKRLEAASSFIVKNAVKYIQEYHNEKLTLQEVAEYTYVSKWHLSKLLNEHTGYGFSELLNLARINHAKDLLTDQSLMVSDVAEMVGFLNLAHFSRVFKKMTGVSPSDYRNRLE